MIYDTFLYDGEEEMLRLRIETLKDVVDVFVPVIGLRTFQGKEKDPVPSIRPALWDYRILDVTLALPPFRDPWQADFWHRDHALTALSDLAPDDIVLVSDLDEIPDPKNVTHIGAHEMDFYYYSLRWRKVDQWIGTVGIRGESILMGQTPSKMRVIKDDLPRVKGGWHFSYFFMDEVGIRKKLQSFGHAEFNAPQFTDLESIHCRMSQGLDLFDRPRENCYAVEPSSYLPEALKASLAAQGKVPGP